jgi:hypothetical protein
MFADMRTTILMVAVLVLYFYFRPSVPEYLLPPFFAVWISCYYFDVQITISNLHLLEHERNLVFPTLYRKMGKKVVLVQFLVETAAIVIIVMIFEHAINIDSIAIVSLVFGISHLEAYFANMFLIKKIGKKYL